MQAAIKQSAPVNHDDDLAQVLRGYRFTVCESADAALAALDVRRQVYVGSSGYDIQVPDEYDRRSWFLLAEDVETGKAVGSMRITPRFAGPLEAEEYFALPESLRSPRAVEISRFAILPAYRKGKTFLPSVSVGLFKLTIAFMQSRGTDVLVICSKPERVWTYEWLQFRRTGLVTRYAKLANAEHELLAFDFTNILRTYAGHPFGELLVLSQCPEIALPRRTPLLGMGVRPAAATPRRMAPVIELSSWQ